MKTPMNELIDKAIAYSRELSAEGRLYESIAVDHIIDLAESLLEKEEEMISGNVSKQRELLLAYHKHLDSFNDPTIYNASENMIDDYLANNCA